MKFDVHVVFTLLLHVSVFLGLLNEWLNLLSTHFWILWFLVHIVLYTIYVVLVEFSIQVQPIVKNHLVVHSFFVALWYLQRVFAMNFLSVENYEEGCKRDLLMTTSSVTFTILLLSMSAVFTRLIV